MCDGRIGTKKSRRRLNKEIVFVTIDISVTDRSRRPETGSHGSVLTHGWDSANYALYQSSTVQRPLMIRMYESAKLCSLDLLQASHKEIVLPTKITKSISMWLANCFGRRR